MIKPINVTELKTGRLVRVMMIGQGEMEAVEIGSISINLADLLRLSEYALHSGPRNPVREKHVENVSTSIIGESPFGVSFKPSMVRKLAGTASGL